PVRYAPYFACDADNTLHVWGGENSGNMYSWRLVDGATKWIGPYTSSYSWRKWTRGLPIPSSGMRDIVVVGGGNPGPLREVLRWVGARSTWTSVCSSAPWSARFSHAIAYVGNTLVLTGGDDGGPNQYNGEGCARVPRVCP